MSLECFILYGKEDFVPMNYTVSAVSSGLNVNVSTICITPPSLLYIKFTEIEISDFLALKRTIFSNAYMAWYVEQINETLLFTSGSDLRVDMVYSLSGLWIRSCRLFYSLDAHN